MTKKCLPYENETLRYDNENDTEYNAFSLQIQQLFLTNN